MLCYSLRLLICSIAILGLASSAFIWAQAVPGLSAGHLQGSGLSINGTKFEDRNGDGHFNEGEPGMAGWKVVLVGNGLHANATTDDLGGYSFAGLNPGRYVLREESEPGWNQTYPGCREYEVTLTDRSAGNLNFGDCLNGSGILVYREYPLMHLSREELQRMKEESKRLPEARLLEGAEIARRLQGPEGQNFSLLNRIEYCPAERDQGRCGNCWIWAGMGTLEVDMAVRKGIKDRLSIQYLNSYYWCCNGGAMPYFTNLLNMTGMAIPWSNANAQWCDSASRCGKKSCVPVGTVSTNPCYRIVSAHGEVVPTSSVGREAAIRNIKNVLLQGRAIYFSFLMPTKEDAMVFTDYWANHSESEVLNMDYLCGKVWDEENGSGHAVVCIGYDDTDPGNRYWVMLNSWGTTPRRPHGLFRISMDMNYGCTAATADGPEDVFEWDALSVQYGDPVTSRGAGKGASSPTGKPRWLYRPLGSVEAGAISWSSWLPTGKTGDLHEQ